MEKSSSELLHNISLTTDTSYPNGTGVQSLGNTIYISISTPLLRTIYLFE